MQKFNGSLIRQFPSLVSGNAAAGVEVTVLDSTSAVATLYEFDDVTGAQLPNPLTTSATGFYSFYAENGNYTLQFNSPQFPDLEIQLNDIKAFGVSLEIVKTPDASFSVDASDNATFFVCENNNVSMGATIDVTVGESVSLTGNEVNGAIIMFTQINDPQLTFIPAVGVTIIAPNQPKAFGIGSTVALISIDRYTWILCGDTSLEPVA